MKSISLLASLAAVSVICTAVACSSKSDDNNGSAGTSAGGSGAEAGEDENGGKASGGKTSAGEAGDTSGEGGDKSGEGGDTSTPGGGISTCTGALLEGDPLYNDKPDVGDPKPAGQGLLDDPPIRNEAVAIIGNKLFIETEFEIWSADLSAAKPKLARFAGTEGAAFINAGVACKDTTFLVIRDMTATADGKLVVVDYVGGAVIEITDPGGPNCKSDWVAGTHVKTADPGSAYPLSYGEMDGPGAGALFGGSEIGGAGIHKVTVDASGNIYTWDEGTGKFKKIATDADRTVSTIGLGSTDDNIMGLAWLKGKLYATGVDGTNDFLIEVDPAKYDKAKPKDNVVDVFRDREHFADVEGGHQAITAQVISDGSALIISGQSGFVWRVAADGTVLATLAGSGAFLDYQDDFDPLVPHPGKDWQLVSSLSNSNGGPWLAFDGESKLYWSGGIGIGKYTLQFSCQ